MVEQCLLSLDNFTVTDYNSAAESTFHDLVEEFLTGKEGTSCLLIGPRQCGKTTVIANTLKDLKVNERENVTIIWLNGLLQHDDRSTVREISKQLLNRTQRNDTDDGDVHVQSATSSYARCFQEFKSSLASNTSAGHHRLLFVLEEFDRFAARNTQSLLYTLLDASQGVSTLPTLIVGVTCQVGVVDMLEKRVRSRFSNRHIHFTTPSVSLELYVDWAEQLLTIGTPLNKMTKSDRAARKTWNDAVELVFSETKNEVMDVLRLQYETNPSIGALKLFLKQFLLLINTDDVLSLQHFRDYDVTVRTDSDAYILRSLSLLELCLLISAMRLSSIHYEEDFNFEMVYQDFIRFANKHKQQLAYSRSILIKVFDKLEQLCLICPASDIGGGGAQRGFARVRLQVAPWLIVSVVNAFSPCPAAVQHWCASKIA